jgi:hypothetical protein
MLIILINGSNNSGKDQFVEYFMKNYEHKTVNMSTIDKIKEISKKHFNWNGIKTEESRKFLSDMKKLWSEFNNGPFLYMIKKIEKYYSKLNKKDKKKVVFFIHCREPEEIQKIKEHYNQSCLTILLKRNNRPENKQVSQNQSDMGVDNYSYDKIICNDGDKSNLELESIKFIQELNSRVYNIDQEFNFYLNVKGVDINI